MTSALDALRIAIAGRRTLLFWPLVCFVTVVSVALLLPRTYTVRASFLPNSDAGNSRAAGLAAQFGVMLPGGSAGHSPEFYAELIRSNEILVRVVDAQYEYAPRSLVPFAPPREIASASLIEILGVESDDIGRSRNAAIEALKNGILNVSVGRFSGTVEVIIRSRWPDVSLQIAQRLFELVDEFNLQRRQTQASAERAFVHARLEVVRTELAELERLERESRVRQQLFTVLTQSYEQARIDEVRNTPVVTVVQQPAPPLAPDRRRLALKGLAAILFGFGVGAGVLIGSTFVSTAREADREGVALLMAEVDATRKELRRPWRLLQTREPPH
jgi:uncharacterized protein involved in exopolysaccharide biosynthesis